MEYVELGTTGQGVTRIGLGAMPLSLSGRPERSAAKAVVRRAVELGLTFIDTADSYCRDDTETHHNERLIREALEDVDGGEEIIVATKGGFERPRGHWTANGKPEHLRKACEGSLEALGTDRIDLYQFHIPDTRVPFEASVEAVAALQQEGKVRWVGLSNVSVDQIEAARGIVEVTSVQNRFNPWDQEDDASGLIDYCDRNGITYIPYSPVGGSYSVGRIRRSAALAAISSEVECTPEELVLAWMLTRSPSLVPIPGASRLSSIESSVRALDVTLDDDILARTEDAFVGL
jgi:aryl-alcohol dehydrogenase-like predicted oxidoreductase